MLQDTLPTSGSNNGIVVDLKDESVWIDPDEALHSSLMDALSRLARRVISDWDDMDGWKWDIDLRRKSIIHLYQLLSHYRLDKGVAVFVFHQLLSAGFISSTLNDGDNDGNDDQIEHPEDLLSISLSSDVHRVENFKLFLAFVESKRVYGLPNTILQATLTGLRRLLDKDKLKNEQWISYVRLRLDTLFRHFLTQDFEIDKLDYPSARDDLPRILGKLIEFAHDNVWYDILLSWRVLLLDEREKLDDVFDLGRFAIERNDILVSSNRSDSNED